MLEARIVSKGNVVGTVRYYHALDKDGSTYSLMVERQNPQGEVMD